MYYFLKYYMTWGGIVTVGLMFVGWAAPDELKVFITTLQGMSLTGQFISGWALWRSGAFSW